jgi:hypothetical protein
MNTLLSSPCPWRVEGENEKTVKTSIRQPTIQSEILNWSLNCPPRNAARPAAAATPITTARITPKPVDTSVLRMPGLLHRPGVPRLDSWPRGPQANMPPFLRWMLTELVECGCGSGPMRIESRSRC